MHLPCWFMPMETGQVLAKPPSWTLLRSCVVTRPLVTPWQIHYKKLCMIQTIEMQVSERRVFLTSLLQPPAERVVWIIA